MPTEHKLTNAFTRVAECFEHDAHLDLSPAENLKVLSLHVTTAADLDLGPPMWDALFSGDTETFLKLEKQRLAAKPDMEKLRVEVEAMERKRREEELLTPVKRVEVDFVDSLRFGQKERRWHLTHTKVHHALASPAFHALTETAKAKGFTTLARTESFLNMHGDLNLRLTLVFEKLNLHGGLARTFKWSERP